ncbi:MAG: carboxypeptidase regulatory-like domain-containing protein [Candidatus Altiarchaeota archaeon]
MKASKTGFEEATDTFKVENNFDVKLPAADSLQKGSEVVVKVLDSGGNPVEGASVSVEGKPIIGSTDANGLYKFLVSEVGKHTIVVSKSGYSTSKSSLLIGDELKIALSVPEVELDGSITITTTDSTGLAVDSEIRVTAPDGTITTEATSKYTFTPKASGKHTVQASKQSYSTASAEFNVKPRPVMIGAFFEDDKIVINLTSRGKPVSGVDVIVTSPSGNKMTLKTGSSGRVSAGAELEGNYTLEVSDNGYEAASGIFAKKSSLLSGMLLPLIVVLVVLAILFIIVIIAAHLFRSKRKGSFDKGKGSSLGG